MYYELLSRQVNSGKLRLLFVIAPPRTSSTLLEKSLSFSPTVTAECHEPFIHVGYSEKDPDLAYQAIASSVDQAPTIPHTDQKVVIVKDMAQWLIAHDEYQRLFQLTKDPILFLMRNPLLTMESRIKKVVQAIALAPRISTQQAVLDYFAHLQHFQDWNDLVNQPCTETQAQISQQIGLPITELTLAYTQADLNIQSYLLDIYARSQGSASWSELTQTAFTTKDYRLLDGPLKFDAHRFTPQTSGWEAFAQLINYLKDQKSSYAIVDSTEFRLDPETVLPKICELFRITYSEGMIRWGELQMYQGHEQNRPQDLIWYDTLHKSTGIKPPTETVPTINKFPADIQDYLKEVGLPIYSSLFRSGSRIPASPGQNTRPLEISPAIFRPGFRTTNNTKTVFINDIDPIFATLYDPSLLYNEEYIETHKQFAEELNLVRLLITEATLKPVDYKSETKGEFRGRRC